ncbi:hypothetical protein RclHR1_17570006 [Rhizophagus clarus]|uniref:Uncharacterized protein n=1 Tax=Rhizophagus clarus TaxID=94130 RepID=A0A2Z6QXR0_9GLOM|nr:hypothetical protein RclHR1_17570006 [Rhizophagus clarus]GET01303.1 hypothetical protein GLOIN_2v1769705 [Rhizophagus clarus]
MNAAKKNHFAFNNKGLHFAEKNAFTYHVCGSINHRVRTCPENSLLKYHYGQQTAYQDIYKRYKVEALKLKSVSPNLQKLPLSNTQQSGQNKTGFNPKSNRLFLKDVPSNIPQSQGIKQFEQRLYNLEKRLDKSVDSNINLRLEKVKQQLNKFSDLMKKFNDRIVNLKMHILNQSNNKPDFDLNFSPVTDSFVNTFNKRVRTEEDMSDIVRTSNPQLSNFPTQTNISSSDINMQNSQDELSNSQDFYYDAIEHNQNPII